MELWEFVPSNGGAYIKRAGQAGYIAREWVATREADEAMRELVAQANAYARLMASKGLSA